MEGLPSSQVAGHALWKEYRNQFEKLLCVLIKQYLPKYVSMYTSFHSLLAHTHTHTHTCTHAHTHTVDIGPFSHNFRIEAVTSAGQGGPTTRLRQFLDVCIQTLHKYSLNLIFHFVLLFRNVLPLALSQNQKEFYLLDCGGANTGSTFWIVERLILVLPSGLWRG